MDRMVTLIAVILAFGAHSAEAANISKNAIVLDAKNNLVGEVVGVVDSTTLSGQLANAAVALDVLAKFAE